MDFAFSQADALSLAPPPMQVSLPPPPLSLSLPAPPSSLSLPPPPLSLSLPASPQMVSLPPPPLILSLPAPPVITSAPGVPVMVSLPEVPVWVAVLPLHWPGVGVAACWAGAGSEPSKAPASQLAPTGRATPRWSTPLARPQSTSAALSIAGLPKPRACVRVVWSPVALYERPASSGSAMVLPGKQATGPLSTPPAPKNSPSGSPPGSLQLAATPFAVLPERITPVPKMNSSMPSEVAIPPTCPPAGVLLLAIVEKLVQRLPESPKAKATAPPVTSAVLPLRVLL